MAELTLRIEKIREGTVIDHISAGKALTVLNILGLDGKDGRLITVGINVSSRRTGKKDIIKVERVFLNNDQLNQISLISPNCTISYIKDFKVDRKFILSLPKRFYGIFSCPNENCISNSEREPVKSEFDVISENPIKIKCVYCNRILFFEEIANISQKR
ncbi:MAG: aspartate carbamoyltransferase regulatory subunit [Candidatus Lokiarchaeota archaeon]|nr:aspartate carbamoyltransferase regulatory subunit [Candidatus Lokiarchaeota archaeon]